MCGAPPFRTPWTGCSCECTGGCASAGTAALGTCIVGACSPCTAAGLGCAGRAAGALSPTAALSPAAAAADMGVGAPACGAPEVNQSLSLLHVDGVLPVGLAVDSAFNGGDNNSI